MNVIIIDLETKFTFDEVGGRDKHEALGISVAGIYDYATGKFDAITENEIGRLEERLALRPLIVGFNSKRFDIPVLRPYVGLDLSAIPQLDIMEEIQNAVGHRIGLDAVAKATLGHGKSGSGLDAIKYYRNGEMDKLKRYCLDDVKVTKEIYEYGAKHKELFFTSRYGTDRVRVAVGWDLPLAERPPDSQLALF